MNEESKPKRPRDEVVFESTGIVLDIPDTEQDPAKRQPIRTLASIRLLVRERVLRGMPPLPEGFQLPPGITLEDVLKPPPPFPI